MRTIGRYQIREQVASYGVAIWFRAHDPELDRLVTLEAVPYEGEVPEAVRTRFHRLARTWAGLWRLHPALT